jgi:glycosyltransferase involved in cell wall biosynthesis
MGISVTILTKNSSKYLKEVLDALDAFDEVVVFDNGSCDETLRIAAAYGNVVIHEGKFDGFGKTHNIASALAKNEWILSIDSDEVVTPEMCEEVLSLKLDAGAVYSFPRHNYFNGRLIKGCGWYPDRQYRLYHRGHTRFTDADVHESIIVKGMHIVPLKGALVHYSYACVGDFLSKMQSYSTLFAQQYCGVRRSSPLKAVLHGIYAFFKSYILKKGILCGYEGLLISTYNGHTAYYKYLKLYEANKKVDAARGP